MPTTIRVRERTMPNRLISLDVNPTAKLTKAAKKKSMESLYSCAVNKDVINRIDIFS